jgi:seryl-tRNA synthetase
MLSSNPPYSPQTIRSYTKSLSYLDKHVDLNDSKAVISYIMNNQENRDLRKMSLFNAYNAYCRVFNIQKSERKLRGGLRKTYRTVPEIPSEDVINKIIDNANVFYSIVFEFLKDTG